MTPSPAAWSSAPTSPTTQTSVIPSYLYQQYQDDPDLPAFILAYNSLAQQFITTINDLNLPIYTGDNIAGGLLDWVALGLYGMLRPNLSLETIVSIGELNTYQFNTLMLGANRILVNVVQNQVTDDIFKRILTWHIHKGDGRYFTVRWLKRRIMRFLYGVNGSNPIIDQTYQISILFGVNRTITVRFINQTVTVTSGAIFNAFGFNTTQFNSLTTSVTALTPLPNRQVFQAAVQSAALELPFQYTWNVVIT